MKFFIALITAIIVSSNTYAGLISFDSASLSVDATVDVEGNIDLDFAVLDIPPGDAATGLPLSADASQNGQAFANSLIDLDEGVFFLAASTESFSEFGELVEAAAVAEFAGELFTGAGTYQFALAFEAFNESLFGAADSFSTTDLVAEIFVDGSSIFSESLVMSGELTHNFHLEASSSAFVNVLIISETGSGTPGTSAFNFSAADFSVRTIPEPSTLFLLGTTLLGLHSQRASERRHRCSLACS